ncbi:MAG: hypothetical protein AAF214_09975 [Pseudomonadota bacterium]
MSDPRQPPVFLERRSYRRRRMMDALRILPVVGVMLWLLPVFWPTAADGPDAPAPLAMSNAVIYVFAVWVGLIAAAFALWYVLGSKSGEGEDTGREAG